MSEPKTPNLGLNKIDRSSPSTTYFDLDKYLDQNWEKIDDFAEQVEGKAKETAAQVSSIQERLDTEQRKSVTLEPGLQIVNADRTSAFKLEGLKGRTLVNLLGRDGNCEAVSDWFTTTGVAAALDSSDKTQGTNSIKVTINTGNTGGSLYYLLGTSLSNSKNYLAIADLKKGTSTSVSLSLWNGTVNVSGTVVTASKFTPSVLLIPASAVGPATNNLQISVGGTEAGQYSHVDAVRLYEITAVELTSLSSMTAERVAAKYPYVDSVQPVRNPYAIRYGENLIPPFYEWSYFTAGSFKNTIIQQYELYQESKDSSNYVSLSTFIPIIIGKTYTLSGEVFKSEADDRDGLFFYWAGNDGKRLPGEDTTTRKYRGTYVVPDGAAYIQLFAVVDDFSSTGAIKSQTFKNIMFNIGSVALPFKPREEAMLAMQTDLCADPITGANADEVFERDGQYFKLAKWGHVIVNDKFTYEKLAGTEIGYKQVYVPSLISPFPVTNGAFMTKYDGKILTRVEGNKTTADLFGIHSNVGTLYVTISNTDSGWGDSYTPTADEIKAYFMGWKMFLGNQGDVSKPYNGESAGKAWCPLDSIYAAGTAATTYVLTVPTSPITTLTYTRYSPWTPYQLIYQLATPTVEPITSEGQLTLIEGNNQIEVGTGIMLREYNSTPENTNPNLNGRREINFIQVSSSLLKTKARDILAIYKNGAQDDRWAIGRNVVDSYGTARANLVKDAFDPSATYTVTYFMLDTSPIAPFVGSVAENEKALLTDMNDIIRQNTAAVSVIETAVKEAVRNMQNKRNVWGPIE